MLTKRELEKIKSSLPPRWTFIISERAKVSPSLAQKVMNDPRRYNSTVMEAAIQLAAEHKAEILNQKQRIKGLAK